MKYIQMCQGQLCPSFELVLIPPENWVEDKAASKEHRIQVLVPRGKTFGNADALIYVKVSVKQKEQSLAEFVQVSQQRWKESVPDTKISKLPDVAREAGRGAFLSYRYENPSRPQQRFEVVSFGADKDKDGNDFVVMVALTGAKKPAVDAALALYQAFLRAH